MDEQKQMTPAPYAAGTGSVPVTPDRAAFDRMGYREQWNTVVNKALELLDGAVKSEGLIIVGATNRP